MLLFDAKYKGRNMLSWKWRHLIYPVLYLLQDCFVWGNGLIFKGTWIFILNICLTWANIWPHIACVVWLAVMLPAKHSCKSEMEEVGSTVMHLSHLVHQVLRIQIQNCNSGVQQSVDPWDKPCLHEQPRHCDAGGAVWVAHGTMGILS